VNHIELTPLQRIVGWVKGTDKTNMNSNPIRQHFQAGAPIAVRGQGMEDAGLLGRGKEVIKAAAEILEIGLRLSPEIREELLRNSPELNDADIDWFLGIARGEVPDDKIYERGVLIMHRIQAIKFN
jgi:hypothetical protein